MSDKEFQKKSMFDVFSAHSETLEDAQKKSAAESGGRKIEMFRMDKEGKYKVRILPLAPIYNQETDSYDLPRKGYEYPAKELLLKIEAGKTKDNKPIFKYVNVRHLKHVLPQLEGEDLIDLFVQVACEKYADDEKLCKSIRENSFSGGLRYDSKRYMYVLNHENRAEGIKMLSLSYAQYKELEDRKLDLWKELREDDPHALCPICSPEEAYPVEITRKKENGKTSYVFNINTRKEAPLQEEDLQALFELPRLPEQLYRYSRFHLEATIHYLKQYEEKKDIDVLSDQRIKELIDQINMLLPSDDTSHFSLNGAKEGAGSDNNDASTGGNTLDDLWDIYHSITDAGKNDKSEEGQNLRTLLVEFIDANDLDVAINRRMSNEAILEEIEDALKDQKASSNSDYTSDDKEDDDDYDNEEQTPDEDDDSEDDAAAEPDEKAPAEERRVNRPVRRRR